MKEIKNLLYLCGLLFIVGCNKGHSSQPELLIPPSDLFATSLSSSQIDLIWLDNSSNETGFRIEKSGNGLIFEELATVPASTTTFSNAGLNPSTTWHYRVKAFNESAESQYTNQAGAATFDPPQFPPAVPKGVTATTISSQQINVSWIDDSNNEEGFRIEKSIDGISFTILATVTANVISFANVGLSGSTTYYYRVQSYNSVGSSDYSGMASATTFSPPTDIPPAPSDLSAIPVSSTQVNLNWTDNSNNEDGFKVERREGSSYILIATLPPGITFFANIALIPSTNYRYRVKSFNSIGDSNYSNEVVVTTPAPPAGPPSAPASLAAVAVSSSQISLTWIDTSEDEEGFKIERSKSSGPFAFLTTVSANTITFNDTGLDSSTTYSYRILAYNSAGQSGYSNTSQATTFVLPVVVPQAPSALVAVAVSSSQIDLNWTDNSNNEDGVLIDRSENGTSFTTIATLVPNTISFSDLGLVPSKIYYYKVRAYNSAGISGDSNIASATTMPLPVTVPNSPSGLVATAGFGRISLSWTDNSNNEDGFKMERSQDGVIFLQITTVGAGVTSYINTGLTSNTTYYYRVRAYNTAGNSDYSNIASATTPGKIIIGPGE